MNRKQYPYVRRTRMFATALAAVITFWVADDISSVLADAPLAVMGTQEGVVGRATQPASPPADDWIYADILVRDYPNVLDPLVDAKWPSPPSPSYRETLLDQSIGRRVTWSVELVERRAHQRGAQMVFIVEPFKSRLQVNIANGFVGSALPTWEALTRNPGPRAAIAHLVESGEHYTPLQLFEYMVSRRPELAKSESRDKREMATKLLLPFDLCVGASIRFTSPEHVAFVDYLTAERLPRENVVRESATVAIYDRKSGEFRSLVFVQFWPHKNERESIDTIMHVLLAGMSEKASSAPSTVPMAPER